MCVGSSRLISNGPWLDLRGMDCVLGISMVCFARLLEWASFGNLFLFF